MADLNAILTRLNDRLLRLEGELFVLRSLARATLTAGDDHAERMRKLVEAAKVALDDEALRPLDKPTRKYVGPRAPWSTNCWSNRPRPGHCSR